MRAGQRCAFDHDVGSAMSGNPLLTFDQGECLYTTRIVSISWLTYVNIASDRLTFGRGLEWSHSFAMRTTQRWETDSMVIAEGREASWQTVCVFARPRLVGCKRFQDATQPAAIPHTSETVTGMVPPRGELVR